MQKVYKPKNADFAVQHLGYKNVTLTLRCGPSSFHYEKNSKNMFSLDACKSVETY